MSRLAHKTFALATFCALSAPLPVFAQATNRSPEVGALVAIDCVPGNITCLATYDAGCRSSGGFVHLSMTMASAVTLRCEPDRHDLDEVFYQANAQTETCTAGHLCLSHGTRTGDESNVYRHLVGMMNSCLQSHGRLEVHAIMPDGPNESTVYAGCLAEN